MSVNYIVDFNTHLTEAIIASSLTINEQGVIVTYDAAGEAQFWIPIETPWFTMPSQPTELDGTNAFGQDAVFAIIPGWTEIDTIGSASSEVLLRTIGPGQEYIGLDHTIINGPTTATTKTTVINAEHLGSVRTIETNQEAHNLGHRFVRVTRRGS